MTDTQVTPEDLTSHVLRRAIVLEDARVLYVPTPKSACTSIMWGLAGVAGIPDDRFHSSISFEPTSELTIHDMDRWDDECRLVMRSPDDQLRILNDEGWFRFTVVRGPAARVWSAWQSKVLVREPWMVRTYAGRSWFPSGDPTPDKIIEWYRAFLRSLDAATIEDGEMPSLDDVTNNPHWMPQTALLGESGLRLLRIGRLEHLQETLDDLAKHLADHGVSGFEMHSANTSRIPYDPALLDESGLATVRRLYREDFERFGYSPPEAALTQDDSDGDGLDGWRLAADASLGTLQAAIEHNERFDVVQRHAQEQRRTIERLSDALETLRSARQVNLEDNKRWLQNANIKIERLERQVTDRMTQISNLKQRLDDTQGELAEARSATTEARRAGQEAVAEAVADGQRAHEQAVAEGERAIRVLEGRLAVSKSNTRFAETRARDASLRAEQAQRELDAVRGHWSWRLAHPLAGRRAARRPGVRKGRRR